MECECYDPNMQSHLSKVLHGEYDIPIILNNPVILDIGSNVGSFMTWVLTKKQNWFNPIIYCYEPMKKNFEYLHKNKNKLSENGYNTNNINLINKAVGNSANTRLFHGINNCGEASFYDLGEQNINSFEIVETIVADTLPKADIIKIDTEGSELDIIKMLNFEPIVFLLEYHSEKNRRGIDVLLKNYCLYKCDVTRCGKRGVLKYIHKNFIE
jgi:FkbM family methyltransferase